MMRDAEKTVGNMIDKLKTAFIGSIDGACGAIPGKQSCVYLLL